MAEETAENPIIEIDAALEYRDGDVFIKKMITNEMPAKLLFKIIETMSENIKEHYSKIEKNKED